MDIQIERFYLRKIISECREVNSAVRHGRDDLWPWFWWANASWQKLFRFLLVNLCIEKLAVVLHDLPYNHKFIIRADGNFAGVIGIDHICQNAAHPEVWLFVTPEYYGGTVASRAMDFVEEYARDKNVTKIYARTASKNLRGERFLRSHGYQSEKTLYDLVDECFPRGRADMKHWVKQIKTVEK